MMVYLLPVVHEFFSWEEAAECIHHQMEMENVVENWVLTAVRASFEGHLQLSL